MAQVMMPQKRDKLGEAMQLVANGLSIANNVYGLKANIANASKAELESQDKQKTLDLEAKLRKGEQLSASEKSALSKQYIFKPARMEVPEVDEFELDNGDGTKLYAVNREQYKGYVEERSKKWDRTQGLRKEFAAATEDNRTGLMAHQKLLASADGSPLGDVAMLYQFMKVLDPTSTVREGEVATVKNARGVPDSIRNMWNNWVQGQTMTVSQRANMAAISAKLASAYEGDFKTAQAQFKTLAENMDLDYKDIDRSEFADDVKKMGAANHPQANPAARQPASGDSSNNNSLYQLGTAVKDVSKGLLEDLKGVIVPTKKPTPAQGKPKQRRQLKPGDL